MQLGKERLCLTGQELGLYSFYRFHQLRDKEIIRYLDSWSETEDLDSRTDKERTRTLAFEVALWQSVSPNLQFRTKKQDNNYIFFCSLRSFYYFVLELNRFQATILLSSPLDYYTPGNNLARFTSLLYKAYRGLIEQVLSSGTRNPERRLTSTE